MIKQAGVMIDTGIWRKERNAMYKNGGYNSPAGNGKRGRSEFDIRTDRAKTWKERRRSGRREGSSMGRAWAMHGKSDPQYRRTSAIDQAGAMGCCTIHIPLWAGAYKDDVRMVDEVTGGGSKGARILILTQRNVDAGR
jgi:hypothetical protein